MSQVGSLTGNTYTESTAGRTPLVEIRDLSVGYTPSDGPGPVVLIREVNLTIGRGEIVGLVGESGSGKTQTARAILRMNSRPLHPMSGQILLDGVDVLALPEDDLATVRGAKAAMIFQDPRSALNPLLKVGDQLARVYALHQKISRAAAHDEAVTMLRRVGIAGPERVARSYPHQLSGGMCQRVMISMALGIKPALIIADEPTTGLDVTIQAQILELLRSIRDETGASVLLITHDLGVVAETCQRVVVMFAGRVVEIAPVLDLFAHPRHPYTLRLLNSTLSPEQRVDDAVTEPDFPSAKAFPVNGRPYQATIDDVTDTRSGVALIEVAPGHLVLCRPLAAEPSTPPGDTDSQGQGARS